MSVQFKEIQGFIIGETRVCEDGMHDLLTTLGVPDWDTAAESDAEYVSEVAGKLCYMSFDTSLNSNLTRANARDNTTYLQKGIIATKHGSVLEHTTVNVVLHNVSRVLTHELIRHRAGTAFSQLSGRYVRTHDLEFGYIPLCIRGNDEAEKVFVDTLDYVAAAMQKLAHIYDLDNSTDFAYKKEVTSAIRRLAPNGQVTNIMISANHRAWRHIIEMRTSAHAEEEIRVVFSHLFDMFRSRYPALYTDAVVREVNGINEITFEHSKV